MAQHGTHHSRALCVCDACGRSARHAARGLCGSCYARRFRAGEIGAHRDPSPTGPARCEAARFPGPARSPFTPGARDDDLIASIRDCPPPGVPLFLTPPLDLRASTRVVFRGSGVAANFDEN